MALKAFLEQVAPSQGVSIDGRRHDRRPLRLHTSGVSHSDATGGGVPANVTIHNLSAVGLLIETDLELVPGDRLVITLPDVGAVGAQIVWVSERLYGCAFEQALGEGALAASQLLSEPAPLSPEPRPSRISQRGSATSNFGTRINRLRRERSLTLEQVANALGVSKPTVWAWEKGKARPLPERIARIAEVLGVAESELSGSGKQGNAENLVEECRVRIASEYQVQPECVRIMIEV